MTDSLWWGLVMVALLAFGFVLALVVEWLLAVVTGERR